MTLLRSSNTNKYKMFMLPSTLQTDNVQTNLSYQQCKSTLTNSDTYAVILCQLSISRNSRELQIYINEILNRSA